MYRILHLHWLKSFISAEGGMCVLEEQHPAAEPVRMESLGISRDRHFWQGRGAGESLGRLRREGLAPLGGCGILC